MENDRTGMSEESETKLAFFQLKEMGVPVNLPCHILNAPAVMEVAERFRMSNNQACIVYSIYQ